MFEWFADAATGIAEGVSNALATVISYLLAAVLDVMTGLVSCMPTVSWPFTSADVASLAGPALAWNAFVPITEGFAVVGVCLAFSLVCGLFHFVLSLIPGVA